MKKFILDLAGFKKNIVDLCTQHNQGKYYGIALSMFVPAIMAFASFYTSAGYYHINTGWSIVAGVIGFSITLLIESIVMRTFQPKDKIWKNFLSLPSIFRILLLLSVALLFSQMIDLKLASLEIEERLKENLVLSKESKSNINNEAVVSLKDRTAIDVETADLAAQKYYSNFVKPSTKSYESATKVYQDELDGEAASGKKGKGPIALEKEALMKKAESKMNSSIDKYNLMLLRQDTIQRLMMTEIANLDTELTRAHEEMTAIQSSGLFARKRAYEELKNEYPEIKWQAIMIFCVLLFMDLVGLVSKYSLTSESEYYTLSTKNEISNTYKGDKNGEVEKLKVELETELKKKMVDLESALDENKQSNHIKLILAKEIVNSEKLLHDVRTAAKVDEDLDASNSLIQYAKKFRKLYNEVELDDADLEDLLKSTLYAMADKTISEYINAN